MAEELEVIIGANTKGIEEGATRAERALSDVQKSIKRLERDIADNITISRGYKSAIDDLTRAYKSGDVTQDQYSQGIRRLQRDEKETQVETRRLTAEMRNLQREQKQLSAANNMGAGSMNKMGKATRVNAVPAMTSFSQIIQDSPYGIQGVANNIQQLTMQMGYLSKSSGGAGSALKAMVGSLLGPAGILLAVSAITTALISYGDEILDFIKNTSDAELAQRKLTEAMASGIADVRTTALEVAALSDEIVTNNGSLLKQVKAYKKLEEVAPELTEIYTLQEIAAGKADEAIKKLTGSLLEQAQIDGAKKVITELNEEMFKLESNLGEGTASFFDWLEAAKQTAGLALTPGDYSTFRELLEMKGAATGREEINELEKELGRFTDRYRELIGQSINPTMGDDFFSIDSEESRKAAAAQQKILDDLAKKAGNSDPIRIPVVLESVNQLSAGDGGDPRLQASLQWQAALTKELELLKEQQSFLPQFSEGWKMYGEAIAGVEDRLSGFANSLAESGQMASEEFAKMAESEGLGMLNNKLQETNEYANIFASSVGAAMSELGNVMQEKLADSGKAVQIFGGLVINTMTQVLSQLLQQAIQERLIAQISKRSEQGKASAKGVTIATNAAAAAGPVGLALLPGFLASTQAMIQGSFAAIEGFNFGGFVGDRNLVRMNGNERVLTATEANTFNNLMQNRNVGTGDNSMKLDLHITGGLSGENISFALERYNLKSNRIG